jgi:hypothetical protein
MEDLTTSQRAGLLYLLGAFLVSVYRVLLFPRIQDIAWETFATIAIVPLPIIAIFWITGQLNYKNNSKAKQFIHWTTVFVVGFLLLVFIMTLQPDVQLAASKR